MRAMICVASSKHRSMRLARMWNSKSPGVETAWRAPARISRNGCSSAGRGGPKSRSHASDPNPMTQERPPSRSRNSTARTSAARSPQNERRVARLLGARVERHDQEDRGAGERRGYRLREGRQAIYLAFDVSSALVSHRGSLLAVDESRVNDLVKIASLGIEAFWSASFENFCN